MAIRNQGIGAGQIGVSGTDISYGGTIIGSFAGGVGGTLTVTFNAGRNRRGGRRADPEPDLRQCQRRADGEPDAGR